MPLASRLKHRHKQNKTKRFGRSSGQTLGAMNHSVENSTHVDSCLKIKVARVYKDNSSLS